MQRRAAVADEDEALPRPLQTPGERGYDGPLRLPIEPLGRFVEREAGRGPHIGARQRETPPTAWAYRVMFGRVTARLAATHPDFY